jgi:membrane protease subunit HflK
VDSRNGSNLLYLPLDRLLQQAGAAPASAGAAPAEALNIPTPAAAPAVDARAREGSRTRDRETR